MEKSRNEPVKNGQPLETVGWGGRIRTSAWRNQNPLPYRLATPQLGSCLLRGRSQGFKVGNEGGANTARLRPKPAPGLMGAHAPLVARPPQ